MSAAAPYCDVPCSFVWYVDGIAIATTTDPTVGFSTATSTFTYAYSAGAHTVSVDVLDQFGGAVLSVSATVSVTPDPLPPTDREPLAGTSGSADDRRLELLVVIFLGIFAAACARRPWTRRDAPRTGGGWS
jgi:hypothetical protein